jgi:hypothetical protein
VPVVDEVHELDTDAGVDGAAVRGVRVSSLACGALHTTTHEAPTLGMPGSEKLAPSRLPPRPPRK